MSNAVKRKIRRLGSKTKRKSDCLKTDITRDLYCKSCCLDDGSHHSCSYKEFMSVMGGLSFFNDERSIVGKTSLKNSLGSAECSTNYIDKIFGKKGYTCTHCRETIKKSEKCDRSCKKKSKRMGQEIDRLKEEIRSEMEELKKSESILERRINDISNALEQFDDLSSTCENLEEDVKLISSLLKRRENLLAQLGNVRKESKSRISSIRQELENLRN